MHPRLHARRQLVALVKARDDLLAYFGLLIPGLDDLSQVTERFSNLVVIARSLRSKLTLLKIGNSDGAAFIHQIKQHMAEFTADLLEFESPTRLSPAAKETD